MLYNTLINCHNRTIYVNFAQILIFFVVPYSIYYFNHFYIRIKNIFCYIRMYFIYIQCVRLLFSIIFIYHRDVSPMQKEEEKFQTRPN